MPWVRLDDRFPSHRKVALLSDRAFRLYVSALCWSAENLTEGKITDRELPVVARLRGIKAAARELEAAHLWDRVEDGWEIHDYLIYQRDRDQVQAERTANAARQKAWRDRRRANKEATSQDASNAPSNGVTPDGESAPNDATTTRQRHDDDTTEQETDLAKQRESQVTAIRNAPNNATPTRPNTLSLSEKEKEERQLATRASSDEPPRIGDRPRIPTASQPLVDALTAAGLIVGWELQPPEWFLIEALIRRCGIPALVVSARGSWQGARSQPRSGRYFLPAWRALPDSAHAGPGVDRLPAQHGGEVVALSKSRQQQETDDWADRAMQRAQARMQESS